MTAGADPVSEATDVSDGRSESEGSEVGHRCRTLLVDDSPARADAFSTEEDLGPHRRVAHAIVEVVSTESGGRAIGLEGSWGSGKSTVVQLVRSQLEENDNFEIICFDAWAHEGDPLRRTYLETLVRRLQAKKWIEKERWDEKLGLISRRRRETTTRTTPRPTSLARCLAVALFLVPLGTALVAADWDGGITFDLRSPPAWGFILGLALSLGPLFVLLFYWLIVARRQEATRNTWQLLISNSVTDSTTETVETPDPTSIEFADHFDDLTKEALEKNEERRLLLVLDNLDRVEPASALAIWSTLQTFLQERYDEGKSWFRRIWVLVPYDPEGLGKLWDKQPNGARRASTTDTFLDKSFQVRFFVPPPVLSDWKTFLLRQLQQAMPDHDSRDWHKVYRVFDACKPRPGMPTLRELKLFVNQAGAVHRQWQHQFPLEHVAFYVLYARDPEFLLRLREGNGVPAEHSVLLGTNAERSLAGLMFNVEPSKGMELLLTEPLQSALSTGKSEELRKLSDAHPNGFMPVLEKVVASRAGKDFASVRQAALAIEGSKLLEDQSGPEARTIVNVLKTATIDNKGRIPTDESAEKGLGALLRLQKDADFTKTVLKCVAGEMGAATPESKPGAPVEVAKHLANALHVVSDLGHGGGIPQFSIQSDAPEWKQVCVALKASDPKGNHWKHFKPTVAFSDINTALVTNINEGRFDEQDLQLIQVTTKAPVGANWKALPPVLAQRLDPARSPTPQESEWLLAALWDLRRSQPASGQAARALKALADNGHILHHLHGARKNERFQTMCMLTFLEHRTDLSQAPAVGNSSAGHASLEKLLAAAPRSAMSNLAAEYGPFRFLFDVIDKRGKCDPLVQGYLRQAAKSTQSRALFSSKEIRARWSMLCSTLGEEAFTALLGCATKETTLVADLQEGALDPAHAGLYRGVLNGASTDQFTSWCTQGLSGMTEQQWGAALSGEFECIRLLLLIGGETRLELPTAFSDALLAHASALTQGERAPPADLAAQWTRLPGFIGNHGTRHVFLQRTLAAAGAGGGGISKDFLAAFGGLLANGEVLGEKPDVSFSWFSALMKDRNIPWLSWLRDVLKNNQGVASETSSPHAQDFRARVQECLDTPIEDGAQSLIDEMGAILQLTAQRSESDVDDEPMEGQSA